MGGLGLVGDAGAEFADALGGGGEENPEEFGGEGVVFLGEAEEVFFAEAHDGDVADGVSGGGADDLFDEGEFTEVLASGEGGEDDAAEGDLDLAGGDDVEALGWFAFFDDGLAVFVGFFVDDLEDAGEFLVVEGAEEADIGEEGEAGGEVDGAGVAAGGFCVWGGGGVSGGVIEDLDNDGGGVVVSAAFEDEFDEAIGEAFWAFKVCDIEHFDRFYEIADAIRADHEHVVGLEVDEEGIGFDGGFGAEGAGDDVFVGEAVVVFGFEFAGVDEFLKEGVVFGELVDFVAAEEVEAGVADVADEAGGVDEGEEDGGCGHARHIGLLCAGVDFGADLIEDAGDLLEDLATEFAVALGVVVGEGLDKAGAFFGELAGGDGAGLLAAFASTAAVADSEEAELLEEDGGVFVLLAHQPWVCALPCSHAHMGAPAWKCWVGLGV